jgi:hypothetical protein
VISPKRTSGPEQLQVARDREETQRDSLESSARGMAAKQSMTPNARYHCRSKDLRGGANFSRRSDPQIAAARWGATIIKTPSAIATALTSRFIAPPALIHMLAHVKLFFGMSLRNETPPKIRPRPGPITWKGRL